MLEHVDIAIKALMEREATGSFAKERVSYALVDLYANDIVSPSRIPWH